jgi:hypothetical protein
VEQLKGSLLQLSTAVREVGAELGAPPLERIDEIVALTGSLGRLPPAAPNMDGVVFAALVDDVAFEAMSDFDIRQAEYLTICNQLSTVTDSPETLAAEQERLGSLAALIKAASPAVATVGELVDATRRVEADAARLDRIIDLGRRVARALGIETDMTIGALGKLLEAARHAAGLAADLRTLRHPSLHDDGASGVLANGHDRAQQLATKKKTVSDRLSFELDGSASEWRAAARTLRGAGWLSGLRADVRGAKSKYRGLMRQPGKSAAATMLSDLETVADVSSSPSVSRTTTA